MGVLKSARVTQNWFGIPKIGFALEKSVLIYRKEVSVSPHQSGLTKHCTISTEINMHFPSYTHNLKIF
jgi:hypothetical protein